MLVRLNDDVFVSAKRVIKVMINRDKDSVVIYMDDGSEHYLYAKVSTYTLFTNVVNEINKVL